MARSNVGNWYYIRFHGKFENFGFKLVIRIVLMCTRFVRTRGQGHCLTFDLRLSQYDNFNNSMTLVNKRLTF